MDIKFIKNNKALITQSYKKRNVKINLEEILNLDQTKNDLIIKVQRYREEKNKISKNYNESNKNRAIEIKKELEVLEPELKELENKLKRLLWNLPNLVDPKAPVGNSEENNLVVKEDKNKPQFTFPPKDHVTVSKKLDLIDFDRASKVSGSNFYYFKNQMVILEQALIRFALDILLKEDFKLFSTPELVKTSIIEGIGFKPKGPEAQIYKTENTDLGLIATSEITLGGYLANEIIPEKELPLKFCGYSHCFRTEAGAYGRESRGLYRTHQFSKVEMFIFSTPEESSSLLDYIVSIEEKIYKELGFTVRLVDICSGDLGAPAYRKYDLEAWMSGMNKWGEITSASNCTDYQSKRLNIKYRGKDGRTNLVHTLNGTAIATSRVPIVILENFQKEDGTVVIPEKLQKYTGFSEIKSPHGN